MSLNMLVRSTSDTETNLVAVERCFEYTRVPQEVRILCDFYQTFDVHIGLSQLN